MWRHSAAAVALLVALDTAPAAAQFGGIDDLFGGEEGDAGCVPGGMDEEGNFEMPDLGDVASVGGGAVGGMAGGLVGGPIGGSVGQVLGGVFGETGGGCASEMTQWLNYGEQLVHGMRLVEQIENQIKMLARGTYDDAPAIMRGIRRVKYLLGMSDRVMMTVDAALGQYDEVYPEEYPELDRQAAIENQREQLLVLREAARTSKAVSAGVAEKVDLLADRVAAVSAASQNAEGQTSAIQAGTQAQLLALEVQSDMAQAQLAHMRAQEAKLDMDMAARARAKAHVEHMWRDIDTFDTLE